ncbi:MAG: NRDE family protein [bacterium]
MCTVAIFYKMLETFPVLLAGNRDEFLTRSSLAPHRWEWREDGRNVPVFAGVDLQFGGTWMGVNSSGVIAGVTNVSAGPRDPGKASRGHLVLRCLAHRSVREIREFLTGGEHASQYNPFNLFCLSRDSAFFLSNATSPPCLRDLEPGIHVLTNRPAGDPDDPKRIWIEAELSRIERGDPQSGLVRILSHHAEPAGSPPVCIHLPGYGTVASHFLFLGRELRTSRFLYCSGPPCQSGFADLSGELRELFSVGAPAAA